MGAGTWREIRGREGLHGVPDPGRVKSGNRAAMRGNGAPRTSGEKTTARRDGPDGRHRAMPREDGRREYRPAHRPVAGASAQDADDRPAAGRIDLGRHDDKAENPKACKGHALGSADERTE